MKPPHRSIYLASLLLFAALLMAPTLGRSADATPDAEDKAGLEGWINNYPQALDQAKNSNKLILATFVGSDWCPFCMKLRKEVFSSAEFKAWAKDNVILLEVDFPRTKPQSAGLKQQNQTLRQEFKAKGVPNSLFISAAGKEVGRIHGYAPTDQWLAKAEAILKQAHE